MSRRLLLTLMFALAASIGNDCSGGSSGSSSAAGSTGSAVAAVEEGQSLEVPVPEPSAALLFGLGLLVAGVAIRRKR
jgi:hypothetical protein